MLGYYSETDPRKFEEFAAHYKLSPMTGGARTNPKTGRPFSIDSSISLESWHDLIHVLVGIGDGNEGHMADPAIAGVIAFPHIF
jgi:hypothetical protein